MTDHIARRLKARRESRGMTQEELASKMGFNHRQTLAAIENGQRRIRPKELGAAARILEVEPDFFTDRYSAPGEALFSFRSKTRSGGDLEEFELQAGRWVATFRTLGEEEGSAPSFLGPSLSLTPRSSYEDAQAAAEQVRRSLGLGRAPARELEEALEREWNILVLHVDPPAGISGAACRLGGLQAILINRNESLGRRNYDLAHELFHLLTWEAMAPSRIDSVEPAPGQKRIEELANNFAAALLMPEATVREAWDERLEEFALAEWIVLTAARLGVSAPALKWRLRNLGHVSKRELPSDADLREAGEAEQRRDRRRELFSARFVRRVHAAVERGTLSLRRASRLLGLDSLGFAELCRAYGRPLSYEI